MVTARKFIVGNGLALDWAWEAWSSHPSDVSIEKIVIPQSSDYKFELTALDALSPDIHTAFVAFGDHFSNFKRMELMALLMERGFKLEPFISPHATLAANVKIGINAFIGDRVIVGHNSRIDYNCVLRPGVQIGSDVHIRSSCWLESGVILGDNAQIGAHSTLRMGALVSPNIKIGRNCELGWPRRYDQDIPAKTTFDARYDAPIYTYEC